MKMSRVIAIAVAALAIGLIAGVLFAYGLGVFANRDGPAGGEALFLPLAACLVLLGFWIGREIGFHRGQQLGYRVGFRSGQHVLPLQGINCRHSFWPFTHNNEETEPP